MIFRFIMIIPLAIFSGLYSIPVSFVGFIAFWAIIFTGQYPQTMWGYVSRYFRFATNINAYYYLLTDVYPPFNGREETPYPVRISFVYPERMSRLSVFFRFLILFPHYFFAMFYGIGYMFISFLNFWAVLFTGRIPDSFFEFIKRFFIYISRVNAYSYCLIDEYPPFNGHQPQSASEQAIST